MRRFRCVDWCDVPDAVMADLYEAEVVRWRRELHWDTASNWVEVERGRRLGTVRGAVVVDAADAVAGWGFALVHAGAIQIGDLVSTSTPVTEQLVEALLDGDDAVDTVSAFTREVPGIATVFEQCGLQVAAQAYLACDLETLPALQRRSLSSWNSVDGRAVRDLLRRSYPGIDPSRPFAPSGREPEWTDYLSRLIATDGCGVFDPEASGWLASAGGQLAGVVIATRLASEVGHIAQVAVDGPRRGHGLGRQLVHEACARMAAAGCRQATLFVDRRNVGAIALYDHLGFRPAASFVAAGRLQPRRLTRPVAGVATITRR